MVVSINAVELASELADQRTHEICSHLTSVTIPDTSFKEDGSDPTEVDYIYVDEAQDVFNEQYDYYFTIITNLQENVRRCHLCEEPTVNKYCENKECEVNQRDESS